MNSVKLSAANNVYLEKSKNETTLAQSKNLKEPVKDGNKKLKLALVGLGAVGAVIAAGVLIYRGRGLEPQNITSATRRASRNGGEALSEVAENTLQCGNKNAAKGAKEVASNVAEFASKGDSKIQTSAQEQINQQAYDSMIQTEARSRVKAQKEAQEVADFYQREYKAFHENHANLSRDEVREAFEAHYQQEITQEAQARIQKEAQENAACFANDMKLEENFANKSAHNSAVDICTVKTKKSTIKPVFDQDGNRIKNITTTKSGVMTEELDAQGNVIKRINKHNDGKTYTTSQLVDVKLVEMNEQDLNWGAHGHKMYIEENGKTKSIGREYCDPIRDYRRSVEYLDDGISKTTIQEGYEETIIFRDKKGNIIDTQNFDHTPDTPDMPDDSIPFEEAKELAQWYKHYLKLCEKYGVSVRVCGVEGGAGSHYYELLQAEKGEKAWNNYIMQECSRARYDEKARLMQFLREFGSEDVLTNLGFTKNDISTLIKMDSKTLRKLISTMREENISASYVMKNLNEILSEQKAYGYQHLGDAFEEMMNRYHNINSVNVGDFVSHVDDYDYEEIEEAIQEVFA